MGREVAQSFNPQESPRENVAESHTREPVEEMQKKHEQYEVWRSPFDFQETLEYLLDEENHKQPKSLDMTSIEMGEDEAKMIGEAVASHPSLEVLTIKLDSVHEAAEKLTSPGSMWPIDSFLNAAFLGEKRNTSVVSLVIAGSGTDGDIMRLGLLPQVLRDNSHIRQFAIHWHGDDGASKEDMQDLFKALQGNSAIESLQLPSLVRWDFPDREDEGFIDADTFKLILKLVEHNTSIQKLQLQIGECRPSTDVNLDAFYRALRSNSTIRILHLTGLFYTEVAESEFSNWIRTNLTLRELHLEGAYCEDEESPVLKVLLQALRENKGLRKLILEEFPSVDDDDVFEEFMNALKENSTIQDIVFDPEPDREEEVKQALKKNLEH